LIVLPGRFVQDEVLHELIDVNLLVAFKHCFILQQKLEFVSGEGEPVVDFGLKKVIDCDYVVALEVERIECLLKQSYSMKVYLQHWAACMSSRFPVAKC